MRNHNFSPDRLARLLTEDPDVMNESLFGYHVKRGNSDIDRLLFAIEVNYIEWDLEDPKFQMKFFKIFKVPSGTDSHMMGEVLLKTLKTQTSSQDPELINKLIYLTKKQQQASTSPVGTSSSGVPAQLPKSGIVTMNNGAKFDAAVIIDGASRGLNPIVVWLGVVYPNYKPLVSQYNHYSHARRLPELFQYSHDVRSPKYRKLNKPGVGLPGWKMNTSRYKKHFYRRPYKIITVKKINIASVH